MLSIPAVLIAVQLGLLTSDSGPRQLWEIELSGRVIATGASSSLSCVAAVTESEVVVVLNPSGQPSWQSPLKHQAHYQTAGGRIAVAPSCDWVSVWTGWASHEVEILRRDGSSSLVSIPKGVEGSGVAAPRSMDISPRGDRVVIGTENSQLLLVTREGNIATRVTLDAPIDSIAAEFSADGERVVVTGWWITGVMKLTGEWVWRSTTTLARITPSRDLSAFAAYMVPAHGPQYGSVAGLDAGGETLWSRHVEDPAVAITPHGDFIAFSGTPMPTSRDDKPSSGVWLVDPTGKTLAHGELTGRVEFISRDGRCVVLRESGKEKGERDLVGRDLHLTEAWRLHAIDRFGLVRIYPFGTESLSPGVLLQSYDRKIRAYRLPGCSAGSPD